MVVFYTHLRTLPVFQGCRSGFYKQIDISEMLSVIQYDIFFSAVQHVELLKLGVLQPIKRFGDYYFDIPCISQVLLLTPCSFAISSKVLPSAFWIIASNLRLFVACVLHK
jgi:hypothetical protein